MPSPQAYDIPLQTSLNIRSDVFLAAVATSFYASNSCTHKLILAAR